MNNEEGPPDPFVGGGEAYAISLHIALEAYISAGFTRDEAYLFVSRQHEIMMAYIIPLSLGGLK